MNMRSTLLLIAASAAPLCAQHAQELPAAPAAQQLTALAATAAPAATPAQRAAAFPALALLPASVSDVAVMTELSANAAKLDALLESDCGLPEGIDNVAFATTPVSPQAAALLAFALQGIEAARVALPYSFAWAYADAEAPCNETVMENLMSGLPDSLYAEHGAQLEGPLSLPTAYIVITMKPGHEATLQEWYAELVTEPQEVAPAGKGVTPIHDLDGWSGRCFDLGTLFQQLQEPGAGDSWGRIGIPMEKLMPLFEKLAPLKLHVLFRLQGNALIVGICQDPQQLQLAASPEDSVLGTGLAAPCDASLAHNTLWFSHTQPWLENAYEAYSTNCLYTIAESAAATLAKFGGDAAARASYGKAAAGLQLLTRSARALYPAASKPTTLHVWHDGDLHITLAGDARGARYAAGRLRHAALCTPSTALYVESTPCSPGRPLPDGLALFDAALDVADGLLPTLGAEVQEETRPWRARLRGIRPELATLLSSCATIGSGLDGHATLVLDSARTALPPFLGAPAGTEAEMPRLVLSLVVADRSKLTEGWAALYPAAAQLAAKLSGKPKFLVDLLPIRTQQEGALTTSRILLPQTAAEGGLNLTLSDAELALGSSAALNAQLVGSATGTVPFAGCVVSFKPAPLAQSLRRLGEALAPAPAESAAATAAPAEPEGGPVALIGGADGPTSVFVAQRPSTPAERSAGLMENAQELEEIAQTVQEVRAAATTSDGRYTLKLLIDLKE